MAKSQQVLTGSYWVQIKFASSNFQIDWDKRVAICPRGHQSKTWSEKTDVSGQSVIDIKIWRSH